MLTFFAADEPVCRSLRRDKVQFTEARPGENVHQDPMSAHEHRPFVATAESSDGGRLSYHLAQDPGKVT
jgi:hypothetical protein